MENIKLRSTFNKRCIPITAAVARQSKVVREKLEARKENSNENSVNEKDNIITIGLRGNALEKIIQWCEHHKDDIINPEEEEECYIISLTQLQIEDMPLWDEDFFRLHNLRLLMELICSAEELKIRKMWLYAKKSYGMIMTSKTGEQMRRLMRLDYDNEVGSPKAA